MEDSKSQRKLETAKFLINGILLETVSDPKVQASWLDVAIDYCKEVLEAIKAKK